MSAQHFRSLLFKSAQIQREIEREHQRRWPDQIRLLKLKKLRLVIKDRIERIVHERAKVVSRPARAKVNRTGKSDWQSA